VKANNYLLSVLGLSAGPRLFTSLLTLIFFPLLIRSLGAQIYGNVIYIVSIVSLFEALIDFGVSSSTGKYIAKYRDYESNSLFFVIKRCLFLQIVVSIIGLIPLYLITIFMIQNSKVDFNLLIIIVLVLSSFINVYLVFVRMTLTSLLCFTQIAVIDTAESVIRAVTWFIVIFYCPSSTGLAFSIFITAISSAIIGFYYLVLIMQKIKNRTFKPLISKQITESENQIIDLKFRDMINESLHFLWLKLVTRFYQSLPIIMFGKFSGSEIVGIYGSFSKISEIINLPQSIIGNAIAVKAHRVIESGSEAINQMWDLICKLISLSLIISLIVFVSAGIFANFLLPKNLSATIYIQILSFSIFFGAISYLITPITDYLGGLKRRNILLSILILLEFIVLYCGLNFFSNKWALIFNLFISFLMSFAYLKIALNCFYSDGAITINKKIIKITFQVLFYFFLFILIKSQIFIFFRIQQNFVTSILQTLVFLFGILFLFLYNSETRKYYFNRNFLNLYDTHI
jgi:polysaccharide transporter, PST family